MKPRVLLALLLIAVPLTGCPKKKSADEAGVEQSEGASSSDKSGEGATEEMQEKKGNSETPSDAPADDKK